MRLLKTTLFLAAALLSGLPAETQDFIMLLSQGDGKTMYNWSVSREVWDAQPKWSPSDASPPPLPFPKVLEIGEKWMRSRHPEFKQITIRSVAICRASSWGNGIAERWLYKLDFQPMVDDQPMFGGQFTAVVLLNGTLVEPKSAANPFPR